MVQDTIDMNYLRQVSDYIPCPLPRPRRRRPRLLTGDGWTYPLVTVETEK